MGPSRLTLAMLALNALCLAYVGHRVAARAHALLPAGGGGAGEAALHGWGAASRGASSDGAPLDLVGRLESAAESGVRSYFGGGGAGEAGAAAKNPPAGGGEVAGGLAPETEGEDWEWVWEYDGDGSEEEPNEERLRAQAKKKKKRLEEEQNEEQQAAPGAAAAPVGQTDNKKKHNHKRNRKRKGAPNERTNSKLPYKGRAVDPDNFDPAEVRRSMRVLPDLRPPGSCVEADRSVHVLFSPAPKELHAAVVGAFSAAYNSAKRHELRFHFLLRTHRERLATCRHLRVYRRVFPNVACEGLPLPASANDGGRMPACEAQEASSAPACHCGPQHTLLNFAPERLAAFEGWSGAEVARNAAPFAEEMLAAHGVRDHVIFLEPDVVVQGDLRALWQRAQASKGASAYVADVCFARNREHFNFDAPAVDAILEAGDCALDTGAMVLNLAWLRREKARERAEALLQKHATQELWRAGTRQPGLMLLIQNAVRKVGAEWDLGDLGSNTKMKGSDLSKGKILHWKGEHKPWSYAGYYSGKWFKYYLPPARRPPKMPAGNETA